MDGIIQLGTMDERPGNIPNKAITNMLKRARGPQKVIKPARYLPAPPPLFGFF